VFDVGPTVCTHYTVTTIDRLGENGTNLKRSLDCHQKSAEYRGQQALAAMSGRFSQLTAPRPPAPRSAPLVFFRLLLTAPLRSTDFLARSAHAPLQCSATHNTHKRTQKRARYSHKPDESMTLQVCWRDPQTFFTSAKPFFTSVMR